MMRYRWSARRERSGVSVPWLDDGFLCCCTRALQSGVSPCGAVKSACGPSLCVKAGSGTRHEHTRVQQRPKVLSGPPRGLMASTLCSLKVYAPLNPAGVGGTQVVMARNEMKPEKRWGKKSSSGSLWMPLLHPHNPAGPWQVLSLMRRGSHTPAPGPSALPLLFVGSLRDSAFLRSTAQAPVRSRDEVRLPGVPCLAAGTGRPQHSPIFRASWGGESGPPPAPTPAIGSSPPGRPSHRSSIPPGQAPRQRLRLLWFLRASLGSYDVSPAGSLAARTPT
ncbi:hypothetical protein NDU88_001798 [Pleurodeles waltl]|uniref:Uncharacterized protein n=1 Tax=Pleurodeles waltl TaxID=8319 RepID=A0AAV7TJU0_PLEWA|nr:hypothetical protein NDU88_001798 [Pleurodeles waltl]